MLGTTISHYRITDKLGEGGMGVVYKAEDVKLGRAVALKFLPPHLLDSEEHKARFLHEARAAALLDNPNICTVYEIDEVDGQTFLAMACLKGQTLKQKIAARPLPLQEALDIAVQIGQGLQAAHEKGIVHRDIKPANIMITPQGQVKIMDFGLAQLSDRTKLTASGMKLGTPAYMSPEQTEGKPADRRSDIWALGVVLYEMISGRVPFPGEAEAAVAYAIVHTEPEPLTALRSGIPLALDHIVEKALAKEPAVRYQHVEDLLVDVHRLRSEALTSRTRTRGATPSRSNRRPLALAAAPLLLVIAAVAAWLVLRSPEAAPNPLADARFTKLTDFEGAELDAAISPDGRLVTFLSDRDGPFDIWIGHIGGSDFVNLTKGQFPNLLNENTRNVGFNSDGSQIWVRSRFLDSRAGTQQPARISLLPTLGGPARAFLEDSVSMDWSWDGQRIVYHGATGGDPMSVADPSAGNPVEIFRAEEGGHCHYPAWSPDGRFVYFVSGFPPAEMDVWRIPAAGGPPERITSHTARVAYPTLLDNRTLLYVATADDGSGSCLYAMDVESRLPRRISSGVEQYLSIAVDRTAQGERRLVAALSNPTGTLWSVPITERVTEETSVNRVMVGNRRAVNPRWGSDFLLYLSSRGPSHGMWMWRNNSPTELWPAAQGGLVASPALSPDGQLICFSFRRQGKAALYLMNSDGTNLHLLTDAFQVRSAASWSPDGQWVAVGGDEGQGSRVFKVPIAGGAATRLIDGLSYNPVWSPDGRMILYAEPILGSFHPVKAITPDGEPVPLPVFQVLGTTEAYRFLPDAKGVVLLQGYFRNQNFWLLDLSSGQMRQLTNLGKTASAIKSFDISPNGKEIIFDRSSENSDIVLIEIPEQE